MRKPRSIKKYNLRELVVLMLYRDPGLTLEEIHSGVWDADFNIYKEALGKELAALKKKGLIIVYRPTMRPRAVRFRLSRTGLMKAVSLTLLGVKIKDSEKP